MTISLYWVLWFRFHKAVEDAFCFSLVWFDFVWFGFPKTFENKYTSGITQNSDTALFCRAAGMYLLSVQIHSVFRGHLQFSSFKVRGRGTLTPWVPSTSSSLPSISLAAPLLWRTHLVILNESYLHLFRSIDMWP